LYDAAVAPERLSDRLERRRTGIECGVGESVDRGGLGHDE
jgi:hypothetical protein